MLFAAIALAVLALGVTCRHLLLALLAAHLLVLLCAGLGLHMRLPLLLLGLCPGHLLLLLLHALLHRLALCLDLLLLARLLRL